MKLGLRLKELREAAGMSQSDLGKILKVTRNAISQWESDQTSPAANRLAEIARALGVRVDQILQPSTKARDRIVEMAERFFDRHGFEETTIEMICTAADVAPEEFNQFFATKQDLLYAVLNSYNTDTFDDVKRIPPNYGALDARIKYLMRIYYAHDLDHIQLTAALHAFSWQWSAARERENVAQLSEHHGIIQDMMDDAANTGEIRRANFRHASQLILAAYTYNLRRAVFENLTADQLVDQLAPQIDLVLAGLGYRASANRVSGNG